MQENQTNLQEEIEEKKNVEEKKALPKEQKKEKDKKKWLLLLLLLLLLLISFFFLKDLFKKGDPNKDIYDLSNYEGVVLDDEMKETSSEQMFIDGIVPSGDGYIHCDKKHPLIFGNNKENSKELVLIYVVKYSGKEIFKSQEIPVGKAIEFHPEDFLEKGEHVLDVDIRGKDTETGKYYNSASTTYKIIVE